MVNMLAILIVRVKENGQVGVGVGRAPGVTLVYPAIGRGNRRAWYLLFKSNEYGCVALYFF